MVPLPNPLFIVFEDGSDILKLDTSATIEWRSRADDERPTPRFMGKTSDGALRFYTLSNIDSAADEDAVFDNEEAAKRCQAELKAANAKAADEAA